MPVTPPIEPYQYKAIVIGEAPGDTEDDRGIPFVGSTGNYLRELLPDEWKRKLFWSNVIRCHPPRNRKPIPQEIMCCSTYQERDLSTIQPHAILAVGDYSLKYFWPEAWVTGMRGIPFPVQLQNGPTTWCMGVFHPRYVMESEKKDHDGRKINTVLPVYKQDLKKFFDSIPYFASNPPTIYTPPKKQILYPQTEQEVYNLFDRLKDPYATDLETFKLKPYMRDARIITAAFSDDELTFAFPVRWPGCPEWGLRAFNTIMRKKKRWIAQHASFELSWIVDSTKSWEHEFEDIETLARLHFKRAGRGSLDDLSRIFLGVDIKKYSNVDRNRLLDYPMEKILEYNAIDAWATYLICYILLNKVSDCDLENYDRILAATRSTVAMELNGLTPDIQESEKLQKEFYGKFTECENKAKEMPEVQAYQKAENKIFQISAPEQVGHVLVMYCGLQLPKTEKSQQYSTDETDLTPLIGKHPLVDLTLDFREVQKLLSTYIDPILSGVVLGVDGLLHPSYTTIRTRTYRLSSEDPNIQNFPKRKNRHIRRQIVAPKGHIFAAYDYGQLEARTFCMYSKDPGLSYVLTEQAKAIVAGDEKRTKKLDLHWKWLYRVLEVYPQYMDRLARNSGETEESKILKAGRTIIKTDLVFAALYGSQPSALSARTEIPFEIMSQIFNEFWEEYRVGKKWLDSQFDYYQKYGEVQSATGRARNEVLPGNEVINTPIQGLAAEMVLEAQNHLCKRALAEDFYLLPRINIHDDLIFVLPDSSDLEQYIRTIGQEIVKPRFPFVTVPLMSECRIGENLCDLESVTNFVGEYYDAA